MQYVTLHLDSKLYDIYIYIYMSSPYFRVTRIRNGLGLEGSGYGTG